MAGFAGFVQEEILGRRRGCMPGVFAACGQAFLGITGIKSIPDKKGISTTEMKHGRITGTTAQ